MKYAYTLKQMDIREDGCFRSYSFITKVIGSLNMDGYHTADTGVIEAPDSETACEMLFIRYNADYPRGYTGRSMSVSDIVELSDGGGTWFCDSVGFKRIAE